MSKRRIYWWARNKRKLVHLVAELEKQLDFARWERDQLEHVVKLMRSALKERG